MKIIIDCRDCSRLMSEELDHKLTIVGSLRVRIHLVMCLGCRSFKKNVGTLSRVLGG